MSTITITGQTTIFTPPASCRKSYTYEGSYYNAVSNGLLIQNVLSGQIDTACFPQSFTGNGRASSISMVYSPGACPAGYITPGAFTNSGTTTATCCPSGFTFFNSYSSANFGTTSAQFEGCISTFVGVTTVAARSGDDDLVPSSAITGPVTMWAQPITIEYDQQDLALFQTTTSSSSSSSISSSSSSSSRSSSQSSSIAASSPTSTPVLGLSTGAKAGIGIGAAAGALFVLGLIIFFAMRYRKNRLSNTVDSKEPFSPQYQMASGPTQYQPAELDPNQVYRGELPGSGVPYRDVKMPHNVTELE